MKALMCFVSWNTFCCIWCISLQVYQKIWRAWDIKNGKEWNIKFAEKKSCPVAVIQRNKKANIWCTKWTVRMSPESGKNKMFDIAPKFSFKIRYIFWHIGIIYLYIPKQFQTHWSRKIDIFSIAHTKTFLPSLRTFSGIRRGDMKEQYIKCGTFR